MVAPVWPSGERGRHAPAVAVRIGHTNVAQAPRTLPRWLDQPKPACPDAQSAGARRPRDRVHYATSHERPQRVEAAVLPACERLGMGVLVWSPLAAGWLSGRVRRDVAVAETTRRAALQPHVFDQTGAVDAARLDAVEQLQALADDAGTTLPRLAVAFSASHLAVTSVLLGPRTLNQLTSLVEGADLVLSDEVLDRIDAIVEPGTSFFPAGTWRPPALHDPGLRRRAAPRAGRRGRLTATVSADDGDARAASHAGVREHVAAGCCFEASGLVADEGRRSLWTRSSSGSRSALVAQRGGGGAAAQR